MEWKSIKEQNDRWVCETLNYKKNGFFVEIGAYDGITNSSCYVLEKNLDWAGICVEPHSVNFERCKKIRGIVDNNCIYNHNGKVVFNEFLPNSKFENNKPVGKREHYMGFSGILKYHNFLNVNKVDYEPNTRVITKTCITPLTLLLKHNAPKNIDYLSIDAEGAEYEILKNWPWHRYKINLISFECHFNLFPKCKQLLLEKGYKQVTNTFTDVEYERYFCYKY